MSFKFCQQLLRLLERNETLIVAKGLSLRQRPELMDRMMQRMGVNQTEAARVDGGLAWLEARTKCLFCRRIGTCCKWIESSDAQTTPANFCQNYEFYRSCVEHGARTDSLR